MDSQERRNLANPEQDYHGHACQDDQVFLIVPLITIYHD